jgi:DNA-binding Lrp family transcriptional regulator
MDKFDIKIIKEIEKNGRITSSQLGKIISRSQQFVDYRIDLMKKRKPWPVITPQIILNPYKSGLRSFLLFVKLEKIDNNKKFFDKVKNFNCVNWIIQSGYDFDFIIMLTSENVGSLYEDITKLFKADKIDDFDLREITKHQMLSHEYLTNNKLILENNVITQPEKIDDFDKKILTLLIKNGKEKLVTIGTKLGINYKTVQTHIKKMMANGVITGYRPFINPGVFDYNSFFVRFTTNITADYELTKFLKFLSENNNITDSFEFLGRFSNAIIIRVKKQTEINLILDKIRLEVPKLQDVKVYPIFDDSLYKSVI